MFDGRKILVTGGAGFIGSHLVERLVGLGARVTVADWGVEAKSRNLALVLDRIEVRAIDLTPDGALALFSGSEPFDQVFHLAAGGHGSVSVQDPRRDFERNAIATFNLLDSIRRVSPHTAVLYTSSAYVYEGGGAELIRESDPTNPGSPYGVSKLAAEGYVSVFSRIYGISGAVLRLFSVFGPRLRKQIIYDIMCRLSDRPDTLPLRGDGMQVRDLNYVSNVVDALLVVAEKAPLKGEAYNVASGEHVSIKQLAELTAGIMGLAPTLLFDRQPQPGDTSHWFADTAKLRTLGYAPAIPLREGLARTVAWFQDSERAALASAAGSPAPR